MNLEQLLKNLEAKLKLSKTIPKWILLSDIWKEEIESMSVFYWDDFPELQKHNLNFIFMPDFSNDKIQFEYLSDGIYKGLFGGWIVVQEGVRYIADQPLSEVKEMFKT